MQSPPPEKSRRSRSQSRGRALLSSPTQHDAPRYKIQGMLFGDLDPVKYDSSDPPTKACFNCWSLGHQRKLCTKPKTRDYCCNCGRTGITINECPRCARAFYGLENDLKNWIYKAIYETEANWNDNRKETAEKKQSREDENWDECRQSPRLNVENSSTKDENLGELKEDSDWEEAKSYHSRDTAYAEDYDEPNDLFEYMRVKKTIDEFGSDAMKYKVNLDDTSMAEKDSLDENSVVSVDETLKKDKTVLRSNGDPLQDFLDLLHAMKHLPVDTQDVVVLQYMAERKKQMSERKEVKFADKIK